MKRFGFSAYIVDDANSEALGACRGVARLQTERPQPIILVGDHGCGKTHLLHSIVNDVRASSSHTGIAYVSPCNLPDEVRKLVDDPTPVDLAQKAILLVDDLDRFDDDLRVLGDVVRIFLENDHYVVFASRIHPNRLNAVPPELRAALEKARVVEIAAGDTQRQVNLIERRIRQESEETIARQNREIEDLKARPTVAYPGHEKAQGERDDVAALRDCVEERSVDLSESRERLTAANEEIEHLKAESALLAKTSQEKDSQPLEDTHAEAREAREEAAEKERDEWKDKSQKQEKSILTRDRNDAVRTIATEMKVHATAMPDIEAASSNYLERTEEGAFIVKADIAGLTPGLDIKGFLKEMQKTRPHWWPTSEGGGASGGTGIIDGVDNPWKTETWNMTQQGKVLKEQGIDMATRMAKSAGTTVGGLKPKKAA
ncbi:MAG: hypothetical protein IIB38_15795 [Candidatus Hydrogenedentes bacterium]|nr:hypothetical protein [Candidatus Hydrogenedentota bacterium]